MIVSYAESDRSWQRIANWSAVLVLLALGLV